MFIRSFTSDHSLHSPFYMQNVHQMHTKLMNILHGECSSVRILCNPTDAIASKNIGYAEKIELSSSD